MKIFLSLSADVQMVRLDPIEDKELLVRLRAYWKDKSYATFGKSKEAFIIKPTRSSLTAIQYTKFKDTFPELALMTKGRRIPGKSIGTTYYEVYKKGTSIKKLRRTIGEPISSSNAKLASRLGKHSLDLHNELNAKSKAKQKVFGYWRRDPDKQKSGLPFPVVVKVKGYNKDTFLKALEKFKKESKLMHNKGSSPNRWNGSNNGSGEYKHPSGWSFPAGVMVYLRAGVPPTQEFYKAVTGKTNQNLPANKSYVI